ncbi:MAG TPA: sigma-70 family RNA polymerase sigma factor [Thermoanaerobaculia bacterium]|jgi:RNA polymerase sigma-70 factor (ECF subfamily)|nr:sigma-70 family RNA polymerase sigma factor [Thermoanaerobaculia bacterium]
MDRAIEERERLLIEAAQQDPKRFAELYEENFGRVWAFVIRRVGERSVAQDITSEVFHQALANVGRFEWRGLPFAAWLYRIAANAIADHFAKSAREQSTEAEVTVPPHEIEDIERRASLYRFVDRLPAEQRRVLVMRFAEERSIREIASVIGRSEGAVKQLQWRGLQTLRARMGTNHG